MRLTGRKRANPRGCARPSGRILGLPRFITLDRQQIRPRWPWRGASGHDDERAIRAGGEIEARPAGIARYDAAVCHHGLTRLSAQNEKRIEGLALQLNGIGAAAAHLEFVCLEKLALVVRIRFLQLVFEE